MNFISQVCLNSIYMFNKIYETVSFADTKFEEQMKQRRTKRQENAKSECQYGKTEVNDLVLKTSMDI